MRYRTSGLFLLVVALLLSVVFPVAAQDRTRVQRGRAMLTELSGTVHRFDPKSERGVAAIHFAGVVSSGPQAGQPITGTGILAYTGDVSDGTDIFMLERGRMQVQVTVGEGAAAVTVEGRATLGPVALGYSGEIQDGTDIFMAEGETAEMRYSGEVADGTDI